MKQEIKSFHLRWNQPGSYWICVAAEGEPPEALAEAKKLALPSLPQLQSEYLVWRIPSPWDQDWQVIKEALQKLHWGQETVAVIPGEAPPEPEAIRLHLKPWEQIERVAENLWLGEALLHQRVHCYLQPVMDKRGKIFGYESFARAVNAEGRVIGGDKIVAASQALNIDYLLDRYLHVQAIRTFISSNANGFLFINFFPGFIHRPEVYLEGLGETVQSFGLASKYVVLELTNAEKPHDAAHLKNICDYGRSRGYAVSLDDMASPDLAGKLIRDIRPDFIKLDMQLVQKVSHAIEASIILHLVELAHSFGSTVIAEGVETPEMHEALIKMGVDLFQGYLFGPPKAMEQPQDTKTLSS